MMDCIVSFMPVSCKLRLECEETISVEEIPPLDDMSGGKEHFISCYNFLLTHMINIGETSSLRFFHLLTGEPGLYSKSS